jgi:hypothetical protein
MTQSIDRITGLMRGDANTKEMVTPSVNFFRPGDFRDRIGQMRGTLK